MQVQRVNEKKKKITEFIISRYGYVRLRSDFKWLWWVLPRCARDLRDSPLDDATSLSLAFPLTVSAACQMCSPQHLAGRSCCSSSDSHSSLPHSGVFAGLFFSLNLPQQCSFPVIAGEMNLFMSF